MAWETLKAAVADIVKANDNKEITGTNLQQTIHNIIDNMGANSTFKGVATVATNPGSPDGNDFYLASEPGVYANFGITLDSNGLYVFKNSGAVWTSYPVPTTRLMSIQGKNTTGSTIAKGKVVYIGASADTILVVLASNADQYVYSRIFGFTNVSLANNVTGEVFTEGKVSGLDTSAFSDGDDLYLGTSGNMVNAKPAVPTPLIYMGKVLKSHATTGSIYFKPEKTKALSDLSDVLKETYGNRDILTFDLANSRFKKQQLVEHLKSVNLFDKETVKTGYYINSSNGALTAGAGWTCSDYIPVTAGLAYRISGTLSRVNGISWYDSNKSLLSTNSGSNLINTVWTAPANAHYVIFNIETGSGGYSKVQFEQSNIHTTYKNYYQIDQDSVKGLADTLAPLLDLSTAIEVEEKTCINLIDPAGFTQGFYLENNGNTAANADYQYSDFIPVTAGETYTGLIEGDVLGSTFRKTCYYNSSQVVVAGGSTNVISQFTIPAGIAFIKVSTYSIAKGRNSENVGLFLGEEPSFEAYYAGVKLLTKLKDGSGTDPKSIICREDLESLNMSELLTIENSDKILFTGCSYDESFSSLMFKSWINKLSNYIDWQCGNHGVSGQRIIDIADRLRKNTATYGIAPKSYKPTYITIANNGNEYFPGQGESLELYSEQIRIAKETIEALGAKMILGTNHHVNGNAFVEPMLKGIAKELGIPYMGIGWLGEKIISQDYQGFWGGSHPGTRTNSFVWIEWLRFINQLQAPRKVIKVFRGRNAGIDETILNYDNNIQRAQIWQEINNGERSLNTADGSEEFYDRLDEGTTVDPLDENNIITNYTSQNNNNEYVSLMNNANVAFTDKVLIELIINKINVSSFQATIKGDAGIAWYVKDNNNVSTYERIVRDAGLVFQVSKAIYDAFNDAIGTKFTSTKFANGTIEFAYWGKVKSWTMGKGYFLCFTADTSSTQKSSGSGNLVRVSNSSTVAFIDHKTAYRYSYDYFSRIFKPKGKFVAVASTYENGYYTISLADVKYFQYDKVKLIGIKSGAFNIANVESEYTGGIEKKYKAENIEMKKGLTEQITTRGFDTGWDAPGEWINETNSLVAIPNGVDSYPPYLATGKHVVLSLDSDGFPKKIKRIITVSESRAYRKVLIRAVARLFPLIYNPEEVGDYFTDTAQITKTSYDNAILSCEFGGTIPSVQHKIIDTDWAEVEYEFELPHYITEVTVSLYRNIEVANITPSNSWELQIADVSVQL